MQNTASLPADQFDDLLRRLPADLDLDRVARQTKAIERKRALGSGAHLLRLALARGPGGLSLSETAAWATILGFAEMSDPAVKYRLDKAVEFLDAVMACQLADKAPGAAARWAGRILRDSDGSCFRERGSKTTSWRLHAVYDLGRGGFSHLELTDKHGAEAIERGAPIAGEIRIGDRNFARAASLHRFRQQSANQADFIVRVGWKAFSLTRQDGSDFDLITHLGTLPADMTPHEVMLRAKVGPLDPALPLRLIIRRKTPEATAAARTTLRREASREQKVLDPRSLVAAEFMILATSLPAEGYPAEEVLAVYRLRWQIELAFKRLKSLLRMDRIPTRTEPASRSWLTAHLIMALLCDDLSQEFLESSPRRACLTPPTSPRCGGCGTSPGEYCSSRSSAAWLSMICCGPAPTCIAASPIPDESGNRMSGTRCDGNLTPMGAAPPAISRLVHCWASPKPVFVCFTSFLRLCEPWRRCVPYQTRRFPRCASAAAHPRALAIMRPIGPDRVSPYATSCQVQRNETPTRPPVAFSGTGRAALCSQRLMPCFAISHAAMPDAHETQSPLLFRHDRCQPSPHPGAIRFGRLSPHARQSHVRRNETGVRHAGRHPLASPGSAVFPPASAQPASAASHRMRRDLLCGETRRR